MTLCQVIPGEQFNGILKQAYNPPTITCEADKRVFHDEYWGCHAKVKMALTLLGVHDAFGDGDFCMNEEWQLSRGISIELTSEKMMRPEFVPAIQHALKQLPEKYSVFVDQGLLDLENIFLLVQPDQVFVDGRYTALLDRFGLSPK